MDVTALRENRLAKIARSRIDLIHRLIEEGPDPLVFEVCERIGADRMAGQVSLATDVLTWLEIAAWAYGLELLEAEEVGLLSSLDLERRWTLLEAHEA